MAGLDSYDSGVLSEALGAECAQVIGVIKSPMEDKDISKELECETSKVRSALNDLLVKNLVHLNRKRLDTGYTHYRWVRREDKVREYVQDYVNKRIQELNDYLGGDDIVFECGCNRVDYGHAIEADFSCSRCGRDFRQVSAGKGSRKVKSELKRLEKIIEAS